MRELRRLDPVSGRDDLDRVGVDAGHGPGSTTAHERAVYGDRVARAAAPYVPGGAGVGRAEDAGDGRRHRLALRHLLEREHTAGTEIDAQATFAGLDHELDRTVLRAEPAARDTGDREGLAVLCDGGFAVAPRQVEQRWLGGIEPGPGDRLDLVLRDRRERGLQPLVASQRFGRDGVGESQGVDAVEIGDHHDGKAGRRHAQEMRAEARPQTAVAHSLQSAKIAHRDAAVIAIVVPARERSSGGELCRQCLAQHRLVEVSGPDEQILDRRGEAAFAALRIGVCRAPEARRGIAEIAGGEVRDHGLDLGGQHRVGHAERLEDALVEDGAQLLPGELLDDAAQQQEIAVAVEEAAARREVEVAIEHAGGVEVLRPRGLVEAVAAQAQQLEEIGPAARIAHHLVDRDRQRRQLREVFVRRIGELELAFRRQHQRRRDGELLADRGDAKTRPGRDRHAELDAGETIAFAQLDRAAPHDADNGAGRTGLGVTGEQRIDAAFEGDGSDGLGHGVQ